MQISFNVRVVNLNRRMYSMKKLLSLLAAVVLLPVAAKADVLKNVELKGEIQTIASDTNHDAVSRDLIHGNAYNHGANMRALAGLSANLVEDVKANVLFQGGYVWGTHNDGNLGFSGANDDNGTVKLVNANVVLSNLFCCFEATIGRQFYGDESSAVMYFGPNHYNAEGFGFGRALDAAKLVYSDDFKTFTMIAGKVADFDAASEHNTSMYGADLKLNLTDALTAQVYGYDFRNLSYDVNGVEYDDANAGLYGAKLALNGEAGLVSAEYARNFGGHRLVKEHHDTGYMVKADAALNLDVVTTRGTFLYAQEGFDAFGNYAPGLLVGHRLGGDIWDYTYNHGIRMFNLGFDVKPADKWTVSLDGFAFQGREGHHAATWEGDLTVKYAHNEYVELFAGAGYAKFGNDASDYSREYMGGQDTVKGQLGMLIKF